MKIGDIVYARRWKVYGANIYMFQKGKVIGIYPSHILVEFRFKNGNSYKESFKEYQLKIEEELRENDHVY